MNRFKIFIHSLHFFIINKSFINYQIFYIRQLYSNCQRICMNYQQNTFMNQQYNNNTAMNDDIPQMQLAPNPMNQGFAPNPLNTDQNLNQFSFNACNQGIANGFGPMFFNMRDPTFTKTNQPFKQEPSIHLAVIIGNIIFLIGLGAGIALMTSMKQTGFIGLIIGTYVLYLILSFCCSQIKDYISNMKNFEQYLYTYEKMRKGNGYFKFWIECYHYVTVRTKKGTSRRKVVTHTANEVFNVSLSLDESGQVTSIKDVKLYVFIHYLKRYYFSDDASQNRFVKAFDNFVSRNRRDSYQNYTHNFDIQGFEQFAAFTANPQGGKSQAIFYIMTFLGVGMPYALIFERDIARYDIGILKKLTV